MNAPIRLYDCHVRFGTAFYHIIVGTLFYNALAAHSPTFIGISNNQHNDHLQKTIYFDTGKRDQLTLSHKKTTIFANDMIISIERASRYAVWETFERKAETLERQRTINMLADRIAAEQVSHPLRVAIDGRTASGKTTLANEIAAALSSKGRTVIRTSVDGFHRPRAERYRQGRFSAEGYLDDARDWTAIRHLLLGPLGPGGNLSYRTASFDLDLDEPVAQDPIRAAHDAILIVDGTFLQRPELADAWDFVIFVEVSEEVAIQRGVTRDAALFGGQDKAREMHERRYQPAFALYQERVSPEKRAHLVVDNNDPSILNVR